MSTETIYLDYSCNISTVISDKDLIKIDYIEPMAYKSGDNYEEINGFYYRIKHITVYTTDSNRGKESEVDVAVDVNVDVE